MKAIELYFWNSLYWAAYLPFSLLILLFTGQGDILGIIVVGSLMTTILSLVLVFQEGVLLDDFEPAIILPSKKVRQETTVTVSNLEKAVEQNSAQKIAEPAPKPKRKYAKKQIVDSEAVSKTAAVNAISAETKPLEVKTDEKQEQKTKPAELVGVEPEPKMRTDVDLEQLDAPDNDNVS